MLCSKPAQSEGSTNRRSLVRQINPGVGRVCVKQWPNYSRPASYSGCRSLAQMNTVHCLAEGGLPAILDIGLGRTQQVPIGTPYQDTHTVLRPTLISLSNISLPISVFLLPTLLKKMLLTSGLHFLNQHQVQPEAVKRSMVAIQCRLH